MKKSKVLFGVLFSTLILAGGVTAAAVSKASKPVVTKATSNPNNMYGYIYNDSFNNQNNSLTLFVFEGTSTGLADTTSFPEQRELVKVNGVSCSGLAVWGGTNYFQVTYPASSSYEGATLEFESGIVAGDAVLAGCRFVMNSSLKWEFVGFNDSPTVKYQSMPYSDTYSVSTQLLIQYTGGSGMPSDKATNAKDIHNFDNYLTIDGTPLSSLSGGEIRSWSGSQRWLWIRFPAVSEGAVLNISEGMRFYSEVFEAMHFVFNSSGHWDYVPLVENDTSVRNYDYEMFTLDDYNFATNDSIGYIAYPNPAGSIDAVSKSFCFQFIANLDSTAYNITLNFGCSDIWLSNTVFKVTINFSSNVYLTFNGTIDYTTSKEYSWMTDVDYLIEVYAIKTSETSCDIILGRDGVILFKATKDISAVTFNDNLVFSGTKDTSSNYSACSTTKESALERFGVRKLKSDSIPFSDNRDTGVCLTYYGEAKNYYNNYLAKTQKESFVSDVAYANLRARLSAWATANGDSFNAIGLGSFSSIRNSLLFNSDTDMPTLLIIIVSSAMAASIILFLIKKKKRQ